MTTRTIGRLTSLAAIGALCLASTARADGTIDCKGGGCDDLLKAVNNIEEVVVEGERYQANFFEVRHFLDYDFVRSPNVLIFVDNEGTFEGIAQVDVPNGFQMLTFNRVSGDIKLESTYFDRSRPVTLLLGNQFRHRGSGGPGREVNNLD